jgi:hypothetical protein
MLCVLLQRLVLDNPFLSVKDGGRVRCSFTGHEMPPRAADINAYLSSKKLRKARDWCVLNHRTHALGATVLCRYAFDFSVFLPFIVPHKTDDKKLFCLLTKKVRCLRCVSQS